MADRIAHEPVERPWTSIAAEVGVSAGQAYLVGLCLAIAAQQDGAPFVQVALVAIAMGLVLAYTLWILGGSGLPMAVLNLPLLVLAVDATLVASGVIDLGIGEAALLGPELDGPGPPLLAVLSAGAGLLCGLALPGPRRLRPSGRGRPRESVTASADLSHGAVMERLRTAEHVVAVAPLADDLWLDETGENHPSELEPLELDEVSPLEEAMNRDDEQTVAEELEFTDSPWPSRFDASPTASDYLEPQPVDSELPADDHDALVGEARFTNDLGEPLDEDDSADVDAKGGPREPR
jgi:hypothetical protein